jgi:2-keto-4-pentenoate hydratase/2-oxohepta-3-ene-1,7-dioic acid hydratase in catechol pathway
LAHTSSLASILATSTSITRVNGVVRQDARTSDLIFDVATLIAFCSRYLTLEPGDLISTGTPAGVGNLEPGDLVEVEVEGIGVLANPVIAAP